MTVKMYSTGCPKCNVMKKKLDDAKIEHTVVTEQSEIENVARAHGFSTVPLLEVDGVVMDFRDGCAWINKNQE